MLLCNWMSRAEVQIYGIKRPAMLASLVGQEINDRYGLIFPDPIQFQ